MRVFCPTFKIVLCDLSFSVILSWRFVVVVSFHHQSLAGLSPAVIRRLAIADF